MQESDNYKERKIIKTQTIGENEISCSALPGQLQMSTKAVATLNVEHTLQRQPIHISGHLHLQTRTAEAINESPTSPTLTNGWMFVYTIQPVVKPVVKPV